MSRILTLSYDFSGKNIHDAEIIRRKLRRDGEPDDVEALIICWSTKRETIRLSERITVESFPAFVGQFRPLYDFLFIFIAPYIVRRRGFTPDTIVVADFSLAWAGAAVRLFSSGTLELHLNGLPRDIARARGFFHRVYASGNEFLMRGIPDRFVAINDTTRTYLLSRGISEKKIIVRAPDTISSELQFIQDAKEGLMRKKFNIPENIPVLFSAGRLEKEKGFDELIRVFASSGAEGYLVIAGEGILHEELRLLARGSGAGERIVFAGALSRSEMWNWYKDADAFALLSTSEALGMVFWEAMYVGVPVIGRPVGGVKETIGEDGLRGFFWDTAQGADAFGEKLKSCIARGGDIDAVIERARQYVEGKISKS